MSRVLFVTHDGVSHEPLGLEYLSGELKRAGHETKACTQSNVLPTVAGYDPSFVCFQVITGDEERWGRTADLVKGFRQGIKTVFGGPHFLFYDDLGGHQADIILKGEADEEIVAAIEGREWNDLKAPPDLDRLAFPDRSLFYNDDFPGIKNNQIRNSMASRGCPYKCQYCYNSNPKWIEMTARQGVRYYSPEWICEDIERTFRDYPGRLVSFQDDIFGIKLEWLEEFATLYRKKKLPPFFAQLRPHLITEDRVRLIKEAGAHIVSFAVESGNEETRKKILDRHESNELIEKGVAILRKHGLRFRMQNMLALPVEDPLEDALETLRFNMKCKPALSWCSLLQAYPGTAIANYVIKIGLAKNMDELKFKVNATFFDEASLPIRDKEKIERLHKYWSAVVRWPWLYPFVEAAINFDMGKKFHEWVFDTSKQYINQREYWRVDGEKFGKHVSRYNPLDRLGGELSRNPQGVC